MSNIYAQVLLKLLVFIRASLSTLFEHGLETAIKHPEFRALLLVPGTLVDANIVQITNSVLILDFSAYTLFKIKFLL